MDCPHCGTKQENLYGARVYCQACGGRLLLEHPDVAYKPAQWVEIGKLANGRRVLRLQLDLRPKYRDELLADLKTLNPKKV